jgi:hypothetical protein
LNYLEKQLGKNNSINIVSKGYLVGVSKEKTIHVQYSIATLNSKGTK